MTGRFERLIVVVGPSGAGKDSVLRAWLHQLGPDAPVQLVQRLITRPEEAGGEAHRQVARAELDALRAAGRLAFEWQAHGLSYAVPRQALAPLQAGRWLLLNGSREHLPRLCAQAPGCRVVQVTAPPAVLQSRLTQRAREGAADVQARLAREVAHFHADLVVVNDGSLQDAVQQLHTWWRRLADAMEAA